MALRSDCNGYADQPAANRSRYWSNLLGVLLLPLFLTACGDSDDDDDLTGPLPGGGDGITGADVCVLDEEDVEVNTTEANIEYVRTPDACFETLAGYPFEPNYVEVDGLRMHYIDEGPADGEVVLMLHGQPSWSYLYRKMVPVLVEAGYRVIAADHIGMGRSDKPVDPRVHQYEQQVAWNKAFINELGLSDITLFVQDWGSLIGLRVAGDMPQLFARIVIANGDMPVIPPGLNPWSVPVFEIDESLGDAASFFSSRSPERIEGFQQWIDYAAGASYLFAADVVQGGSIAQLSAAEMEAYNTPFPSLIYRAAIRAFPTMVAGIENQNQAAWEALGQFDRPFLALAGRFDPNLGSEATQNKWINHVPGARGQDHRRYDAAHFIQEDVGTEMATQLVEFMDDNPIPQPGPLYNYRYCEILLFDEVGGEQQAEVWNTMPLNRCPEELWEAIDADAIATEFGADAAGKNGPRYWVLDLITPIPNGPTPPGVGDVETSAALRCASPLSSMSPAATWGRPRPTPLTKYNAAPCSNTSRGGASTNYPTRMATAT